MPPKDAGAGAPDRRRHIRIPDRLPFKLADSLSVIATQTINISASGAYCEIDRYIAPMSKVSITLLVPLRQKSNKISSKTLRMEGVVVRTEKSRNSEGRFSIAVFFTRAKESDLKNIRLYVESQLPPG
jgi:hypothetical protein